MSARSAIIPHRHYTRAAVMRAAGLRLCSSMSQSPTAAALAGLSGPGAATSWALLVERHGPDIWRMIATRSRDAHDTDDAYQDFWMGLPRAALAFRPAGEDPERGARAWLMRVAYTTAIDHGRKRRSIQASAIAPPAPRNTDMDASGSASSGPLGTALATTPTSPGTGSEDLAERALLVARVHSAIGILPEAYRRPVLLHLVGGLSYDDLATDLKCTVNHARVKVHRGLKRLREMLGVDEQRLPDNTLAGLAVPFVLQLPAAPLLPLASALPAAGKVSSLAKMAHAAKAAKVAAMLAFGTAVVGALAAAAFATRVDPPVAKAAPTAPPAAPGQRLVLDDFERAESGLEGHGYHDKLPGLDLVVAPDAAASGKALDFSWPADHSVWIDCSYRVRRAPLAELTSSAAATITLDMWSADGADVQHVAVRFCDADGQFFEWRQPLPEPGRRGWRHVIFPLSPNPLWHWNAAPGREGLIRYPLAFVGFAAQLATQGRTRAGALVIDDVVLDIAR